MSLPKIFSFKFTLIACTSFLILLLCPFPGIKWFTLVDVFTNYEFGYVFYHIRIPRTLAAFLAGGGLAVSGMVYQALFRNPLASPYTLGVSGGSSLGAAVCIALGAGGSFLGFSITSLGAVAGAFISILIIYGFMMSKDSNATTLILAGVVISTICSGLIMFLHQISSLQNAFEMMRWTMGGVDGISYKMLLMIIIPLILYLSIVVILLPQLDLFMTGDEIAYSRGVNIRLCRNLLINTTALLIGCIVAVCGPIGFVGIISPHTCRLIMPGVRHRMLAISSFLIGGAFLTLSDTIARILIPPVEIPVGIITAILGGPFFLIILIRSKRMVI